MTPDGSHKDIFSIKEFTMLIFVSVIFLLVNLMPINAATIDTELTKAIEEVITSDELIISVRNININKRRKYLETIFSLEFLGTQQKLSVQLDRGNKKVIIQTKFYGDLDSQTFIMDNFTEETGIKILLLDIKQQQNLEKAEITLYVDCVARGSFKIARKLRDAYTSMRNPQVHFYHEMKYDINVDSDLNIDDVMLQHGNCHSDMQATEPLAKDAAQNSIKISALPSGIINVRRGDLPPPDPCDFNTECCSIKLSTFVSTVKSLQEELISQRSEIQELIRIMKQCHACRTPGVVEVCPAGYTVQEGVCKPSSVCHADACYQGVRCTDLGGGQYQCGPCPAGFTGDGKQCRRLYCSFSPCYPGVLCRDLNDGYQCGSCPEHFTGDGRQCWRLWCKFNPCYPGVECTDKLGSFKCSSCPAGFTGDGIRCTPISTVLRPCDSNPCFSGVECINDGREYKCGPCPRGFNGNGVKCIPTTIRLPCDDEPCFTGVTCTNTGAGFTCGPCPPHYTGDGIKCTRCDQTSCSTSYPTSLPQYKCPPNFCYPTVNCEMSEKGPKCGPCPDQMTGDGKHCKQIVSCANYYCFPGVDCIDTSHGPHCGNCPEGFTGNGTSCKRIFTCRDRPCFPGTDCYDSPEEGFKCAKCPPGFTGNGVHCQRIFQCRDNPCFPGVSCRDTTEGAKCDHCPLGYVGDGISCIRVTTCQDRPCEIDFRCLPLQMHPYYKCESCLPGQTSDGITCADIDECAIVGPCDPTVDCHNTNPGFYCDPCPPGYTGNVPHGTGLEYARQNRQYCVDIDECTHNNGGCPDKCFNTQGSYRCIKIKCEYICQNITHAVAKRSSAPDIVKLFNHHNCINKCDKNKN